MASMASQRSFLKVLLCCYVQVAASFLQRSVTRPSLVLSMSLKPAALPLMDSGKALARSGELLIDFTSAIDVYGGALSGAGAQIRNAGDSIAQAAASCRFKTAAELVCDELREAATCLAEATAKLRLAVEEATLDELLILASTIDCMIEPVHTCSTALEAAGAAIMQRQSVNIIGQQLDLAGTSLATLADLLPRLGDENDASQSGQRMLFASQKMTEAGQQLQGIKAPPTGKSWLKGG